MTEGTTIKMGDDEYVIPPLSFRQYKEFAKLIYSVRDNSTEDEAMDAMVEIIHACMKRNYPDLTRDHLEEILDLVTMPLAFKAVMGVHGAVP